MYAHPSPTHTLTKKLRAAMATMIVTPRRTPPTLAPWFDPLAKPPGSVPPLSEGSVMVGSGRTTVGVVKVGTTV